jgi:hypothetical protein
MRVTAEDYEMFGQKFTLTKKWYYTIIKESGRDGVTAKNIFDTLVERGRGKYARKRAIPQTLSKSMRNLLHIRQGSNRGGIAYPYDYKVKNYALKEFFPEIYGVPNDSHVIWVNCPACEMGECRVVGSDIQACNDPNCNYLGV